MIVEQKALFGIIPIGRKKEAATYTAIPLKRNLLGKTTEQIIVINGDKVSHRTKLPTGRRWVGVTLEYSKDEINEKHLKSKGIVQKIYRYVPDSG